MAAEERGAGVGHLDADAIGVEHHRHLGRGLGVQHGVRDQLAHEQLDRVESLGAAPATERLVHEPAGLARRLRFLSERDAPLGDRPLHCLDQAGHRHQLVNESAGVDALLQEADGASRAGQRLHRLSGETRQDDDLGHGGDGSQLWEGVEPAHVRHVQVEQDDVGLELRGCPHGLGSVGRLPRHLEPLSALKGVTDDEAQGADVIDDEHAYRLLGHRATATSTATSSVAVPAPKSSTAAVMRAAISSADAPTQVASSARRRPSPNHPSTPRASVTPSV